MIVSKDQIVSLHTFDGVQRYQFLPNQQFNLEWSRELRQVSTCNLGVPSTLDYNRLPDIVPWRDWISVFDSEGDELLWSGPILVVDADRGSMNISSRDVSNYLSRTRCPLTKAWDAADPATIAGELWRACIEFHGLQTAIIEKLDPLGDRFDYEVEADMQMADQVIGDLVGLGLRWTVSNGVPILGPVGLKPVAALGEEHFIGGGLRLTRDGSQMANDVLLRTADTNTARAILPTGGLRLQSIVDRDSMFDISNAERAVQQYVRHTGKIQDTVTVPGGSVLHPDAPVSIDQLVPSARVTVEAFGLLTMMELTKVQVQATTGGEAKVSVDMAAVDDDLPELLEKPEGKL
ncbi:hypothetical protein PBI_PIPEFISH_31 [Mycobacterium phage Pipefish]|uniref:Minor tail protein n=1 Tax=Mycobacterium phage Pipefish TaxID=373413 RepID=Q19YX4_9CAUD|nr:minor tail protein [Mycobacterium phage Pipefish]ABD58528.1 hypothetical protein PBI_PIPEFISH_31 [Mycobacterium phage Pipefish]